MITWPDLVLRPINLWSLSREDCPCVGQCVMIEDECLACGRTDEEIEMWTLYSPAEKLKILNRLDEKHKMEHKTTSS